MSCYVLSVYFHSKPGLCRNHVDFLLVQCPLSRSYTVLPSLSWRSIIFFCLMSWIARTEMVLKHEKRMGKKSWERLCWLYKIPLLRSWWVRLCCLLWDTTFFLYNPLTRATENLSDAMHREKSLKPKCIAREERRYLNMFLAWYCNLQKGLQRECVATRTQTIKQLLSPAKSVLQEQCISRNAKHPSLPSLILLCWKKNIVCF